ncbi:MFS transporter [Pelosinus sp. sgz500959]|uniref:MFS transporter n=1 Tax=Pelosinus sp. sgz500959 TaxID=3242472 RepID=UPI0036712265
MEKQSLWNISYIRMCLGSFFQYLTHYTLLVSLPIFVVQFLKMDENQAGLVLTFFQVGAVLFRPFAGKWMDDFEKKRVLFVSLGLFCIICFMYLGVQTVFFLLILRFFHGAGFATGTTATATMVTVFAPPSRMGEGVGYLAVFTSIAMVIGPFIGLKLIVDYSFTVLFAVCAVFGLLAFLCGNISSITGKKNKSQITNKETFSWKDLFEPHALPIALCGGLLSFVYSSLLGFLPLYARKLGMIDTAGYFFAVYALAIVLSRPFIGKLFDRIGANVIVYVSVFVYFIGMVVLSQANNPIQFLLAGAIIGLGFGGLNPSFQTIAVLAAPTHKSGLATSTYFLSMDIGVGVGSFVLGLVVDYTDYRTMYLICSLVVILIAILFYFTNHRHKNRLGLCQVLRRRQNP